MWRFTILITVAMGGLVDASCIYKACPDYAVMEQHPDYEVRTYAPITWATTTSVSKINREEGLFKAFIRLHRYANGKNDRKQKMEMTVPWRMSSTKSGNEIICTMDFMFASRFAANPPVPDDDSIKIVKEDTTTYAVRTFNAFIYMQKEMFEEADKLAESVKNDDTVNRTSFFHVGFYTPNDISNQQQEIWMVKKVEQQSNEV